MKIVINNCFGGYGLSILAVRRIAELLGRPCFVYAYVSGNLNDLILVEDNTPGPLGMFAAFDCNPPPQTLINWSEATLEERQANSELYNKARIPNFGDDRSNPILVQVVEELGAKANDRFSKLKIVEIPDDVKWQIEDYNGSEHIAEQHQVWS